MTYNKPSDEGLKKCDPYCIYFNICNHIDCILLKKEKEISNLYPADSAFLEVARKEREVYGKWEKGCGKHRTLPGNCEFCSRNKCFYNGREVDR